MWRMVLICHKCVTCKNAVGHRWSKVILLSSGHCTMVKMVMKLIFFKIFNIFSTFVSFQWCRRRRRQHTLEQGSEPHRRSRSRQRRLGHGWRGQGGRHGQTIGRKIGRNHGQRCRRHRRKSLQLVLNFIVIYIPAHKLHIYHKNDLLDILFDLKLSFSILFLPTWI